jgi:hypothetical protein
MSRHRSVEMDATLSELRNALKYRDSWMMKR